jgi:hypothetical protein
VQAGGGVAVSEIGVDGIRGQSWIIDQKDPDSELPTRTWRVYLVHENQITLTQATAAPAVFYDLLASFESMITTLRVPESPNANAEGDTSVKRVDIVRFDEVAVPLLGLSLKPVDPKVWLVSTQGAVTTVELRKMPNGAQLRPGVTITTGTLQPGTDLTATQAKEKADLEAAGATVTVGTGTVDGKTGTSWEWTVTQPGAAVGVHTRRVTILEGESLAIVQYSADTKTIDAVKADLEAIVAAVKLPQPQAQAAAPAQ